MINACAHQQNVVLDGSIPATVHRFRLTVVELAVGQHGAGHAQIDQAAGTAQARVLALVVVHVH